MKSCQLVLATNCEMVKSTRIVVLVIELEWISISWPSKTLRLWHFNSSCQNLFLTLSQRHIEITLSLSPSYHHSIRPSPIDHDLGRYPRIKLPALPHHLSPRSILRLRIHLPILATTQWPLLSRIPRLPHLLISISVITHLTLPLTTYLLLLLWPRTSIYLVKGWVGVWEAHRDVLN